VKKIGLFLAAPRQSGGTFQYNQVAFAAICALPRKDYKISILSPFQDYKELAMENDASFVLTPTTYVQKLLLKVCYKLRLAPSLVRALHLRFSSWSRAIDREGLDWVFFPSQDAMSFCVETPAITTIHDLMHRYHPDFPEVSEGGEWNRREILYRGMVRYARAILVDSPVGKRHVLECYQSPDSKVFVQPFAAPPLRPGLLQSTIGSYSLPDRFLFYPAQFWKHKNHLGLVQAIKLVKEQHPEIHLILAGGKKSGWAEVEKEIDRLGLGSNITALGYVDDETIVALYRKAVALVMPTFFGPTNIPPLEAFAYGCPVVISNAYGMPEQVGDAAILIDPNSIKSIAEGIMKIWNDPVVAEELTKRGRVRARDSSLEEFARRFQKNVEVAFPFRGTE
jgi:glycosyltransferase involved in cell wall biosynthesis